MKDYTYIVGKGYVPVSPKAKLQTGKPNINTQVNRAKLKVVNNSRRNEGNQFEPPLCDLKTK